MGVTGIKKILVVDDEKDILKVVKKLLEKEGHEVLTAESARDCFEILESVKPDLILMDVMMPEVNGWEAVARIREDSANKDIIISMLTIRSMEEDKEKSAFEYKADYHISKPIVPDEMRRIVKMLLGGE